MKIKKIIKKIPSIFLIFTILAAGGVYASAAEQLTKEYEFISHSPEYSYNAQVEIKENGKVYALSGVTYTTLSEEKYAEKTVMYDNLTGKKVPESIEDLELGNLTLADATYNSEKKTHTVPYYSQSGRPYIPDAIDISEGDESFTAVLEGVSVTWMERDRKSEIKTEYRPFSVTAKFEGSPENGYMFDGRTVYLGYGNSPDWDGCEQEIIRHFSLPFGSSITKSSWNGAEANENGKGVRYATFTGTYPKEVIVGRENVKPADYFARYTYTVYSASAKYTNGLKPGYESYKVKATASYAVKTPEENGLSPAIKAVIGIGAGIFLLALATAAILRILSKRKKNAENLSKLRYNNV